MATSQRAVVACAGALFLLLIGMALSWAANTPSARGEDPDPPEFSILSEGGSPPQGLVDQISEELEEQYELDREAAVAEETASSVEVAVVPGEEGVCIATESAVGCGTWLDAGLGQLALVEACSPGLDPGEVRVTGLVPDAAASAAITRPPASAVSVSAPLNVYVETFEGDPDQLISAGLSSSVELPWDAADESLTTCQVPDEEPLEEGEED